MTGESGPGPGPRIVRKAADALAQQIRSLHALGHLDLEGNGDSVSPISPQHAAELCEHAARLAEWAGDLVNLPDDLDQRRQLREDMAWEFLRILTAVAVEDAGEDEEDLAGP